MIDLCSETMTIGQFQVLFFNFIMALSKLLMTLVSLEWREFVMLNQEITSRVGFSSVLKIPIEPVHLCLVLHSFCCCHLIDIQLVLLFALRAPLSTSMKGCVRYMQHSVRFEHTKAT